MSSITPFLLQKSRTVSCPLIIASPHSGGFYPDRLFHLSDLKIEDLQKTQDVAVDKLFSSAPASGIPLISGVYGRSWLDLNRHPLELDPSMFKDSLPANAQSDSVRVKTGFGVIPKAISCEQMIYTQKLLFKIEQKRLFDIHFPYHTALQELIKKNIALFGYCVLIDAHSMPDLPHNQRIKGVTPDFVLGNRDGTTCSALLTKTVTDFLQKLGYFVTLNLPYAGAYTTISYGRPAQRCHTLQIEIARHLYWNAQKHAPSPRFDTLWRHLALLTQHLIQVLPTLDL